MAQEKAGELRVEMRVDSSNLGGDIDRAARLALQKAKQFQRQLESEVGAATLDRMEAQATSDLRAAAALEAAAPGALQRKLTPGERFRERLLGGVRAGLGGIAAAGGAAGLAGAAAFGAFRTGNAVESFINTRAALDEQDRLRREDQTAAIQGNFVRQQAAANVNRTTLGGIREGFRQRRAAVIQASTAQTLDELQQSGLFQDFFGSVPLSDARSGFGVLQRLAFSSEDIERAKGSNLKLSDIRQQRILDARRAVTASEIRAIDEEERQAIEAEIRSRFSGFDAARQLQDRREVIEALRAINSSVQSTQPTGTRAN